MKQEQSLQLAICNYLRLQYPKALFNSDSSGLKLPIGVAKQLKQLRSSKGYPDLIIYEPRGNYKALFIELKHEGVELRKKKTNEPATPHIAEQFEMITKLNERGYYATFACGFDQARTLIDWYLKL